MVLVSRWSDGLIVVPNRDMELWWNDTLAGLLEDIKRQRASLMVYTALNIWKERNKRVSNGDYGTPQKVLALIKEEMRTMSLTCDTTEPI